MARSVMPDLPQAFALYPIDVSVEFPFNLVPQNPREERQLVKSRVRIAQQPAGKNTPAG